MDILLIDFLKQYPNCPLCGAELHRDERDMMIKLGTEAEPEKNTKFKFLEVRCKEGHYLLHFDRFIKEDDLKEDIQVNSISLLTAAYDISILVSENWIRIEYGLGEEKTEKDFACEDFSKWMITHDEMLDKLNKLWSIA